MSLPYLLETKCSWSREQFLTIRILFQDSTCTSYGKIWLIDVPDSFSDCHDIRCSQDDVSSD